MLNFFGSSTPILSTSGTHSSNALTATVGIGADEHHDLEFYVSYEAHKMMLRVDVGRLLLMLICVLPFLEVLRTTRRARPFHVVT